MRRKVVAVREELTDLHSHVGAVLAAVHELRQGRVPLSPELPAIRLQQVGHGRPCLLPRPGELTPDWAKSHQLTAPAIA